MPTPDLRQVDFDTISPYIGYANDLGVPPMVARVSSAGISPQSLQRLFGVSGVILGGLTALYSSTHDVYVWGPTLCPGYYRWDPSLMTHVLFGATLTMGRFWWLAGNLPSYRISPNVEMRASITFPLNPEINGAIRSIQDVNARVLRVHEIKFEGAHHYFFSAYDYARIVQADYHFADLSFTDPGRAFEVLHFQQSGIRGSVSRGKVILPHRFPPFDGDASFKVEGNESGYSFGDCAWQVGRTQATPCPTS